MPQTLSLYKTTQWIPFSQIYRVDHRSCIRHLHVGTTHCWVWSQSGSAGNEDWDWRSLFLSFMSAAVIISANETASDLASPVCLSPQSSLMLTRSILRRNNQRRRLSFALARRNVIWAAKWVRRALYRGKCRTAKPSKPDLLLLDCWPTTTKQAGRDSYSPQRDREITHRSSRVEMNRQDWKMTFQLQWIQTRQNANNVVIWVTSSSLSTYKIPLVQVEEARMSPFSNSRAVKVNIISPK
jgi:hypothetical protein